MAIKVRLEPRTEAELRERSASTGRSQQQIMRDALNEYLGLVDLPPAPRQPSRGELYAAGVVIPTRGPLRWHDEPLDTEGMSALEILDRGARF